MESNKLVQTNEWSLGLHSLPQGNWKQINAPGFKMVTFEDGNWTRVDEKGRKWQRVGGRPCPVDEFNRVLPSEKPCYGIAFTMSRLDHWLPDFGYGMFWPVQKLYVWFSCATSFADDPGFKAELIITGRPGNYKLMIKQSFNLQEGIHIAQVSQPLAYSALLKIFLPPSLTLSYMFTFVELNLSISCFKINSANNITFSIDLACRDVEI